MSATNDGFQLNTLRREDFDPAPAVVCVQCGGTGTEDDYPLYMGPCRLCQAGRCGQMTLPELERHTERVVSADQAFDERLRMIFRGWFGREPTLAELYPNGVAV